MYAPLAHWLVPGVRATLKRAVCRLGVRPHDTPSLANSASLRCHLPQISARIGQEIRTRHVGLLTRRPGP